MHRAWGVAGAVVVVVLLAGAAAVVPISADAATGAGGSTWEALQSEEPDVEPDRVVIEIEIQPDGSARWHVRYRVRLTNESVAEAFEAVQDDVEANRLERAGQFKLRMEPAVRTAAEETGREMELREVGVTTDRRQPPGATSEYGIVAYEFVWANFATTENGRLRMGDALTDFFLTEDATMLVTWPEDYRAVETAPTSDENREQAVVWRGPKEFSTDGPRVELESTGSSTPVAVPVSPIWLAAAAILLVALAAGWHRRGAAETEAPSETDTAARGAPDETEPTTGAAAGAGATPEKLLSDEERVIRLLEDNGGRMKQQDVVETLEWSETKTSDVVGDLHEDGKIERYRLGRENVLALPGEMDI
jgi:hypothetical protein